MGKAKYSPGKIIETAINAYLNGTNITIDQLLKGEDNQLKQKVISFTLRNLLMYYGYKIDTTIGESSLTVFFENTAIYMIKNTEFKDIKNFVTLNFNMIKHWSFIINQFDLIGLTKKEVSEGDTIQMAFPTAI